MAMPEHNDEDRKNDHQPEPELEPDFSAHLMRREMALIVVGLVVVVALVATYQEGGMPVLDKILPLITLVFGFLFGQRLPRT